MNAPRPDAHTTARPVPLETQVRRFWPYMQDPPTAARSTF